MTDTEIRIVKRISMYMIERANQSQGNSIRQKEFTCPVCHKMTTLVDVDVNAERDMAFFQGLGLALGVSFEEIVGKSVKDIAPIDLLKWARDLPDVKFPHVRPT